MEVNLLIETELLSQNFGPAMAGVAFLRSWRFELVTILLRVQRDNATRCETPFLCPCWLIFDDHTDEASSEPM